MYSGFLFAVQRYEGFTVEKRSEIFNWFFIYFYSIDQINMILVTGATGLLGSHVVAQLLEKDIKIRALKRLNSDLSLVKKIVARHFEDAETVFNRIEWVDADLLNYQSLKAAMNNVDEVYHCAGIVSFRPEDKEQILRINVEGVKNMVDVALESNVKKFCHVSSIASLGRAREGFVDENCVWEDSKNNSLYSISKYKGELEVWHGISKGLNAIIVNPSIILGAGDWNSGSAELFRTAYKELPFYTFGVNGFVDVNDVARSMLSLMEQNKFGNHYVISAANVPYRELFNMMATHFGKRKPYIPARKFLGGIAWRFFRVVSKFTKSKPLITKETARTANKKHFYSSEKLIRETGFQFRPIERTIAEICFVFKNEYDK